MDGPVKERLTGALIFVAALVIIAPEMFSGPAPKTVTAAATSMQPADPGPPLTTYSMVLNGAADLAAPVQTVTAQEAPVETPKPDSRASEPAPPSPDPSAATREQPDSATADPKGMWWTQVGVYSSRDNAERLAQKLCAAGFDMEVARINVRGKELYRVRAGPVRDRSAALALQSRLTAAGENPSLIAP